MFSYYLGWYAALFCFCIAYSSMTCHTTFLSPWENHSMLHTLTVCCPWGQRSFDFMVITMIASRDRGSAGNMTHCLLYIRHTSARYKLFSPPINLLWPATLYRSEPHRLAASVMFNCAQALLQAQPTTTEVRLDDIRKLIHWLLQGAGMPSRIQWQLIFLSQFYNVKLVVIEFDWSIGGLICISSIECDRPL